MADAKTLSALDALLSYIYSRKGFSTETQNQGFTATPLEPGEEIYSNRNQRLSIDFTVERMMFPKIQAIDPRIVRIQPGANNERHKHAHESLFVVLKGQGEVAVGDTRHTVEAGQVAFVPRWYFHQTFNTSESEELVVLAITDFGLTSAVLGDYDRKTRLSERGEDAAE